MTLLSTLGARRLWGAAGGLLLAAGLSLTSCEPEEYTLDGPAPQAGFTVQLNTSQYPVTATFTNASRDAFLYQWDFGDGSATETGPSATHTYTRSGEYQVQLAVGGRGGTAFAPQKVSIPSACPQPAFAVLAACAGSGSTSWTFSNQPGAIKHLAADGTVLTASTAPLPACQADDQFSFANTFAYSYDAAGGTYAAGSCGPARAASSPFVFRPGAGLGQIVLQGKGAFIGLPDSVKNKTYDIVEASPSRLRLRGTRPDNTLTEVTLMPLPSAIDRAKALLTGGSARTWVLDNAAPAVIVVGPGDADPTGYYPGGDPNTLPACQADDEFTFTASDELTYEAGAETFVAGSPGACAAPRSGKSAFTFGAATGAGIAQFTLSQPGAFIGITDAANRTYRIISISNERLVLRVGPPTGSVVHTIKLRVK